PGPQGSGGSPAPCCCACYFYGYEASDSLTRFRCRLLSEQPPSVFDSPSAFLMAPAAVLAATEHYSRPHSYTFRSRMLYSGSRSFSSLARAAVVVTEQSLAAIRAAEPPSGSR